MAIEYPSASWRATLWVLELNFNKAKYLAHPTSGMGCIDVPPWNRKGRVIVTRDLERLVGPVVRLLIPDKFP
jgi:hypothetical protein